MTPTATKPPKPKPAQAPPSVSAELRKLEEARDEAHAESRSARADVDAWDGETQAMRVFYSEYAQDNPEELDANGNLPKPGTRAAKLEAEIKERMRSENPHQAAAEEARAKFHAADKAAHEFKITRCADRLAELEPDFNTAEEAILKAAVALTQACEQYRVNIEQARAIISSTPVIDRDGNRGSEPSLTFDPRVDDWLTFARDIADAEIAKPGLTPIAAWKLAQHG